MTWGGVGLLAIAFVLLIVGFGRPSAWLTVRNLVFLAASRNPGFGDPRVSAAIILIGYRQVEERKISAKDLA